jgi:tetratricopeptide (TPR) repeat protein
MRHSSFLRRIALLAVAAIPLCAAAPPDPSASTPPPPRTGRFLATGVYGAYLNGRFAVHEGDQEAAAEALLRALAADPRNPELLQTAFAASLLAGRAEAVRLAKLLPDVQAAQLLLVNQDIKTGSWDAAETRIRALPRQGLTQILQPMLLAWAQLGAGRTDSALATLRPLVEGQRMRGMYALQAALINDIAGRNQEAGRLYRVAQSDGGAGSLRMGQIIASWQVRQGQLAEAGQTLRSLAEGGQEMPVAVSALLAAASTRAVPRAADGVAEVYLGLAGSLSQQESGEYAQMMLRLALDLRPDFTAARLLTSDVLESAKRYESALQVLGTIPADDPMIGLVRLRRAGLAERAGRTEEALRDLEQLARDYPDSPQPYATLADILRQKSRYPEAVSAYDKAIARIASPKRGSWPLYYARGIAHDRAHDWRKAERDLQRAMELAPDQPFILNYLGYSWADQGTNLTKARALIEKAMALKPNDGAITDSLGWVVFRQGDVGGAIKLLERAAELQPEDATINSHLGDAYWSAGRKREAQFQWRRALLFNPEPEEKVRLEAKLQDDNAATGQARPTEQRAVQ